MNLKMTDPETWKWIMALNGSIEVTKQRLEKVELRLSELEGNNNK